MDELRWWPMVGLGYGTALGFAAGFGGLDAFLLVLVLGLVGYIAGRALTGEVDVGALVGVRRRR
jgi:hypothetical protein